MNAERTKNWFICAFNSLPDSHDSEDMNQLLLAMLLSIPYRILTGIQL